jgi:hypothetical protein
LVISKTEKLHPTEEDDILPLLSTNAVGTPLPQNKSDTELGNKSEKPPVQGTPILESDSRYKVDDEEVVQATPDRSIQPRKKAVFVSVLTPSLGSNKSTDEKLDFTASGTVTSASTTGKRRVGGGLRPKKNALISTVTEAIMTTSSEHQAEENSVLADDEDNQGQDLKDIHIGPSAAKQDLTDDEGRLESDARATKRRKVSSKSQTTDKKDADAHNLELSSPLTEMSDPTSTDEEAPKPPPKTPIPKSGGKRLIRQVSTLGSNDVDEGKKKKPVKQGKGWVIVSEDEEEPSGISQEDSRHVKVESSRREVKKAKSNLQDDLSTEHPTKRYIFIDAAERNFALNK